MIIPKSPNYRVLDKLKDKVWRVTHLYKIKTKNRGLIQPNPNISQRIMYHDTKDMTPIQYIVMKTRQLGVSTWWLLWWLDDTIFTQNTTTGILAHKWDSLVLLWDIIETAYNTMPEMLKPKLGTESKKTLFFKDINSKIFVSLDIRSTGLHNLHISEWCFCDPFKVRATLGACSKLTNITGESTGYGIGNDGYVTFQEAKLKTNDFKARFLPWFIEKEYQIENKELENTNILSELNSEEKKLKNVMIKDYGLELTPEKVLFRRSMKSKLKNDYAANYPETEEDCFATTGKHYFTIKKIFALIRDIKDYLKENKFEEIGDNYVRFQKFDRNSFYVAGADTAEGLGDNSVLKIIDITKRQEIFMFSAKCGIKEFYRICDKYCREYNNALLAVERNNTGHAVLLGLEENCKYPNLYYENLKEMKNINDKPKIKMGWSTNELSRTLMLNDLRYGIEGDEQEDEFNFKTEIIIYDELFLLEALTFINNNGKYEAEASKTDDNIFATSIAFQMYIKNRKYISSEESRKPIILTGEKRKSADLY